MLQNKQSHRHSYNVMSHCIICISNNVEYSRERKELQVLFAMKSRKYKTKIRDIGTSIFPLTLTVPKVCRRLAVRDNELESPLKISQK